MRARGSVSGGREGEVGFFGCCCAFLLALEVWWCGGVEGEGGGGGGEGGGREWELVVVSSHVLICSVRAAMVWVFKRRSGGDRRGVLERMALSMFFSFSFSGLFLFLFFLECAVFWLVAVTLRCGGRKGGEDVFIEGIKAAVVMMMIMMMREMTRVFGEKRGTPRR